MHECTKQRLGSIHIHVGIALRTEVCIRRCECRDREVRVYVFNQFWINLAKVHEAMALLAAEKDHLGATKTAIIRTRNSSMSRYLCNGRTTLIYPDYDNVQ